MDIRQLKRFVAVAEAKSFNKAAEILAVSQPSLTRSIQLLEESLDARLLERGPRGIFLTPMGEELLPHAKIILNERNRAISSLNDMRNQQGEIISIGTDAAFSARRLPLALAKILEKNPQIKIKVLEGNFREMLDLVREGKIDMVLGSRAPYLDLTGLTFEHLANEGASVVMRSQHPLLKSGIPPREDLIEARWIVSEEPKVQAGWAQMFAQWKLPAPSAAIFTSSIEVIKQCLLVGDFVSVCDYNTYASEIESGQLVRIEWDAPKFHRPSGLFRRSETKLSRSAKAFIETLRRICAEEGPEID